MARKLPTDPVKRCSIDGCNGTVVGRGWCSKHYQRWRINGDPLLARARGRSCAPGCTCQRHDRGGSGESLSAEGYRFLTMEYDHPLHTSGNVVFEHRKVLFESIGPGPHPCHWNDRYGCGRTVLEWGGAGANALCVDHLDNNRANNDPSNLVPCCSGCNVRRGRQSLPDEDILEIRRRFAAGGVTKKELARIFGTSDTTVRDIVSRRVFANLT